MSLPPSSPRPRRRWPWIFGGGFLLGCAVLVALLLVPAIQGWLVRRLVARQAGWTVDFDRIGVGPTGLDTRGLEFTMPGVEASTEPFAIRVAPTRLFSKRELRVEQVEARKIRLVLTPARLAAATPGATPAAPFEGVLSLLHAPMPWALDAAHLDGEIVVRDAGEARLTGKFSLRGGGLTSDTPGEFNYELAADSMILPPGPDHKFSSAGTIRLAQTAGYGIAHIAIEGDLHLPLYGRLKLPPGRLALELTATAAGESYKGHWSLGPALALDLDATLDAGKSILSGHATVHADQSAAASLLGEQTARATVDGDLTFTLNVRTGDLDAAVTGDLDARDWQKLLPQLALLDAFKGRLTAAISRRGDQLTVKSLDATLHGEKSAATAHLVLAQAFDPRKLPATPLAELTLTHWPVDWANPFLVGSGVQLAPGEFSAGWTIALEASHEVRLTPTQPVTVGPLSLKGDGLPAMPALTVSFRPQVSVSAEQVRVTVSDLLVTSPRGDRLEAELALSRQSSTGTLQAAGKFRGELPTLFAVNGAAAPFTVSGRGNVAVTGNQLHLAALELQALGREPGAPPFLALALQRPVDVDLARRALLPLAATLPADADSGEWLRLRWTDFPLAWLSGWVPGSAITGKMAAGESALRIAPEGGVALATTVPWRVEGVSIENTGGKAGRRVDVGFSPEANLLGDQLAVRLEKFSVLDGEGNRFTGGVGVALALVEKKIAGELNLDAELPALPNSARTFGPLHAGLHARFHNVTSRIAGMDEFSFSVRNATEELLTVRAPQPFVFGLSNEAMVALSTLAPLDIHTGRFPLAWLRPWSGALELGGDLMPAELKLSSKVNRYSLQAVQPLRVENFSAHRAGHELVSGATVAVETGLDWLFLCQVQPAFQLAYEATAHLNRAKLDLPGGRALDLNLDLKFKGNEKIRLADGIDFSARLDLTTFRHGPQFGLPAQGILVAQASGDLLGSGPTEFKVRLEGLAGAKPGEVLPPVGVKLRGKISLDNVLDGHVEFQLASAPQPTDLAFDVKINLIGTGLDITSALRSKFVDGDALVALARAFPPGPPRPAVVPAPKTAVAQPGKSPPASDATLPFWGEVRGSFDLDIGALAYDAYRIDHIRGRLDADDRSLRVHDLRGEMFAGSWSGGIGFEHDPTNTTGEHTLTGAFDIAQFDSARVVQAVFPKQLSTIDAQITVHSSVTSRGRSLIGLLDHSVADFTVAGEKGVIRLSVPKSDLVSTAAVFGGTVLLSPELRALGRLLKKFSEMPVEQLRITGRRVAGGEVDVDEFVFQSPQARLLGHGRILADNAHPLMSHPLELSLQLSVKEELAVILGGMSLLEKKPRADGFRWMREPFVLGGLAGAPDTTPLYDLLAKGVSGSSGTWGFLMRRVESEVEKKKVPVGKGGRE